MEQPGAVWHAYAHVREVNGMTRGRHLMLTVIIGAAIAGGACTQKAANEAANSTEKAIVNASDATTTAVGEAADKTKELAGDVAAKTREMSATTGEVVTDAWLTTKLRAKFVDEILLENSHIDVDTTDHAVTLTGTVASAAASRRAEAIASGTEGVARVVNRLVVK